MADFLQNFSVDISHTKKATNNLPKFPQQKSGHTQQQIPCLAKISTHKLHGQLSQMHQKLRKDPGESQVRHKT